MDTKKLRIECDICKKLLYHVDVPEDTDIIEQPVICKDCLIAEKDALINLNDIQNNIISDLERKVLELKRELEG